MGKSPRRAALYATAKIALGSAAGLGLGLLPSCGGEAISSAEVGPATSGAPGAGGAQASGAGGSSAGSGGSVAAGGFNVGGTGLACVGPVELVQPATLPGPSDADFRCCLDFVGASQSVMPPVPEAIETSFDNCCRLILNAVEVDFKRLTDAPGVPHSCCRVIPTNQLVLYNMCAPWGPPVPPDIEWEAA